MALTHAERADIVALISLHGHLVDAGELERSSEVFADDLRLDVSELGGGVFEGLAEVHEASRALGAGNPVAHHVTNVVVSEVGGQVRALSKGLGVNADGTCGSVTYHDIVERGERGWRITYRKIVPRVNATPLATERPAAR
jgi:hypothetical protein